MCLCKIIRPNTGEDWAEVVAADIAELFGLPHAEYHLATYKGQRAVFTPSLLPAMGALMPGNELLSIIDPTYQEVTKRFKQRAHTVPTVLNVLDVINPPPRHTFPEGVKTGADVFVVFGIRHADRKH
jgi:hypothetical protein